MSLGTNLRGRSLYPLVAGGAACLFATAHCVPATPSVSPPALEAFRESQVGRLLGPHVDGLDSWDALQRLWSEHGTTIPPMGLLAIADGFLRAQRPRAAAEVLAEAVRRSEEPVVRGTAELLLGWIALATGDTAAAREHSSRLTDGEGSWGALVASVLFGLAAASEGAGHEAFEVLHEVMNDGSTSESLRAVAALGSGYALYWERDYAAAADVLRRAAGTFSGTPIGDDARYAAAMAEYRAGSREIALEKLRDLAGADGEQGTSRAPKHALVALHPRAIFRESLRSYRGARLVPPDEQIVSIFDLDGRALARAALAQLSGDSNRKPILGSGGHSPPATQSDSFAEPIPVSASAGTSTPAANRTTAGHLPGNAEPAGTRWWLWTFLALVALVLTTLRRRHAATRDGAGQRRRYH
jgi:hypothetical protein